MADLTPLDAGFLELEDGDRHVSLTIGAVSICRGPVPTQPEFAAALAARVADKERLHQKLRTHPLYLAAPQWVSDENFDLAHHVRRVALPAPGSDAELFALIGDAMSERMDRDRPLWQCWVIEGLAENRWAVLTKLHHSVADGITAMQMMATVFDTDARSYVDRIGADRAHIDRHDSRPTWRWNPFRLPGLVAGQASDAIAGAAAVVRGAAGLVADVLRPTPKSVLHGSLAGQRRYAVARAAMADVEAVCRRHGGTVNDVALTAITQAYRTVLSAAGTAPGPGAVRTIVPVSARPSYAAADVGNRVSVMVVELPVDLEEPVEQLRVVRERLSRIKHSGQWQAGDTVVGLLRLVPFAASAWTIRLAASLPQPGIVTLATNIPGPRQRTTILGREVVEILPVPPIAMRLRTIVAILSYADTLRIGISGDYDTAPYIGELAESIERTIAALLDDTAG